MTTHEALCKLIELRIQIEDRLDRNPDFIAYKGITEAIEALRDGMIEMNLTIHPQPGCDPAANKVLEHYQESGLTLVREDDIQIARCLLAEAKFSLPELDKRRDAFLGRMPSDALR